MQIPPQKQYIKKHLVIRPNKDGTVKMEVGDEIPRRWKEAWRAQANTQKASPSAAERAPVKNKQYFDKLETDEYD
jgi:hypothetical protein